MVNRGDSFLSEVIKQIKSKEAKSFVRSELGFHLKEAKRMWVEKGFDYQEAERKAVNQMGSPIQLGQRLNKLHQPRVDWWMIFLMVIIMGLSFLPIISLWSTGYSDMSHFLSERIFLVVLTAIVVLGLMMYDYRKLEKHGWLFYSIGVVILLVINIFPSVYLNGEPMIRIIGNNFLRSFMALPFLFLAGASFMNNVNLKVWHHCILFLFPLYLLLSIGNFSVSFIYISMAFVMLWWSKLDKNKVLVMTVVPLIMLIIGGLYFWYNLKEYQLDKILAWLNPENYPDEGGFIYLTVRELLSTAGWFGTSGIGEFTHSAHADFVLVSLTYNYGYLFAIVLVFILSLFAVRMMVIAHRIHGQYAKLLLVGGITIYVVQFVYNVGMTLGIFPITSISLPFISYGLMPTLFNTFLMGIVLSIFRRKDLTFGSV
ncbi:FtsW/RodA/SpoVE family cell cycle protein [Oceanobacillus saliphilus]|uniref:FtsW/RodA/SpoVE family cell cycle protein n=1 Tax=Oceanobacillus saliphilus TaxID=2925834 RepID=UPI00201D3E23|nr:FtsW/RodA/SpoVE family cell cycle protein [Oceanobacillus saliphilus]